MYTEKWDSDRGKNHFPSFPLHPPLPPTKHLFSSTSYGVFPLLRSGDETPDTTAPKGKPVRKTKNEPEDEDENEEPPPPFMALVSDGKRRSDMVSATVASNIPPRKQRKGTRGSIKSQTSWEIKNEPNEDVFDDGGMLEDVKWDTGDTSSEDKLTKGKTNTTNAKIGRGPRKGCSLVPWAKEEIDLVDKLRKENKSHEQISVELRKILGSIRTKSAVKNECSKLAMHQTEWSSKDAEYLRQAIECFDKDKAITDAFNKLSGRSVCKGIIRCKLKNLENSGGKTEKK